MDKIKGVIKKLEEIKDKVPMVLRVGRSIVAVLRTRALNEDEKKLWDGLLEEFSKVQDEFNNTIAEVLKELKEIEKEKKEEE